MIRANIALKKAGLEGIKGWYKLFSSLESGRSRGSGINNSLYKPVRFCCLNCGNEHNKTACPKCGSKAVRAG
jgi:hypothetical protein